MVDVSKRLSGSPKIQPKPNRMKKWMSEPNLLGDVDDGWIREKDNMEEDGVSFAEEVPELNLVHINKQRVQLRPKRRPPSRDFVKSRASMDFDISVPEEIKEEDEESEQNEATENENTTEVHTPVKPIPPTPPPKPAERNGWKLPTPGPGVVLRKTKHENIDDVKTDEAREPEDNINGITPQSSPEKKHKERKGFKHFFKFRRSRKGRKTPNTGNESKTNLTETYSMSVDSGLRPLGEEPRRRWPNRRSGKSEEKGLNWLLGLFHKKGTHPDTKETKDAEHIPGDSDNTSKDTEYLPKKQPAGNNAEQIPGDSDNTSKNTEDLPKEHALGNNSATNLNGNPRVTETVPEVELTNGHTAHENEANPESVSDLRTKFERISAAF